MSLVLKGIEIENFKSFRDRQYIDLSDLSVLLGANSSGKSTALQALLVIKQTMECNSPDEELLLSGKYVALGDYNDVIHASAEDSFSFCVHIDENRQSEIAANSGFNRINWVFTKGKDKFGVRLTRVDVFFGELEISFRFETERNYSMWINGAIVFASDLLIPGGTHFSK